MHAVVPVYSVFEELVVRAASRWAPRQATAPHRPLPQLGGRPRWPQEDKEEPMRLFLTGLAAISLLSAPIAGCKKDAPAGETPAATTPAGEQPAADKPADAPAGEQPAGNADKPADPAAEAKPADAPAGEQPAADAPAADAPKYDEAAVEAGIVMMEKFGTIMGENKADCDKLADALKPFIEENGEAMKTFNETMEKSDSATQEAVKAKYASRMEATLKNIMEAGMACGENEKVKAVMASMAGEEAPADAPADGAAAPADAPAADEGGEGAE